MEPVKPRTITWRDPPYMIAEAGRNVGLVAEPRCEAGRADAATYSRPSTTGFPRCSLIEKIGPERRVDNITDNRRFRERVEQIKRRLSRHPKHRCVQEQRRLTKGSRNIRPADRLTGTAKRISHSACAFEGAVVNDTDQRLLRQLMRRRRPAPPPGPRMTAGPSLACQLLSALDFQ